MAHLFHKYFWYLMAGATVAAAIGTALLTTAGILSPFIPGGFTGLIIGLMILPAIASVIIGGIYKLLRLHFDDRSYRATFATGWLVLLILNSIALYQSSSGTPFLSFVTDETEGTVDNADHEALVMAAEDLNNVLPQNIGDDTVFDSVSAGQNSLTYYYSLTGLTHQEVIDNNLEDSLFSQAVNRIPCTLWRPAYMKGVEVEFAYYSSDREEVFGFSRTQEQCQ